MTRISPLLAVGLALLTVAPVPATAQPVAATESWDGLVEVNARRIDMAFLLPGADFRPEPPIDAHRLFSQHTCKTGSMLQPSRRGVKPVDAHPGLSTS